MGQYDNYDARGYRNYNYYDSAQPYNENLNPNNPNYGKSFAGIGRFDYNNLNRLPSNLTQDLGASTYQAPPPATVYPGQRNIHEGFGTADVSSTFEPPEKKGIFPSILNFAKGAINRYNPLYEGSKNYDPALQGHVDYMNKQKALSGMGGKTGPYKITRGVLRDKNLVSMFGSNNLLEMYDKQIARMDKTLAGLSTQGWSEKEEDRKRKVFEQRRQDAIDQKNQAIAGATGAAGDGSGAVTTGGAVDTTGGDNTFRDTSGWDSPGYTTRGGFTAPSQSAASQHAGVSTQRDVRGHHGNWAEGGRIGYRNGEFVDEDINIQGPNFDVNENIEMAEGPSPFEMRIDELMDTGMSWEEAYQIASEEFGQVAEGESGEGLASLV